MIVKLVEAVVTLVALVGAGFALAFGGLFGLEAAIYVLARLVA